MAIGSALSAMRTLLKAEIGSSMGVTSNDDTMMNSKIDAMQKSLADKFWWEHLRVTDDATVSSRFTNLPTTAGINYQDTVCAYRKWNDIYEKLVYGVNIEHYNIHDTDESADPILRWRRYGATQFESWPIPVTAQTVRFDGQKAVGALDDDTDTCELDDLLIVFFTAAELAKRYNKKDAEMLAQKASDRLKTLRINEETEHSMIDLSGYSPDEPSELILRIKE